MLKKFRPITPGTRQLVLPMNETLTRVAPGARATVRPEKSLLLPKKRTCGRNNKGISPAAIKAEEHKQHYRIIDFKRDKENIPAKVASIEYDPNRSAYIALLQLCRWRKTLYLSSSRTKSKAMSFKQVMNLHSHVVAA